MEYIKDFLNNDIVERAIKTFVQAFVSSLLVTGFKLDYATWIAALAAGGSAAWNYLRTV